MEFQKLSFWDKLECSPDELTSAIEFKELGRLWGGSGDSCTLYRAHIKRGESECNYVVKHVDGPSRRHVDDKEKQTIKGESYLVEGEHLLLHANTLCALGLTVPLAHYFHEDATAQSKLLVMSDLRKTHPKHVADLSWRHTKCALKWIAKFHSHFWGQVPDQNTTPTDAMKQRNDRVGWNSGGFWALDKRLMEWDDMEPAWDDILHDVFPHYLHSKKKKKRRSRSRSTRSRQTKRKRDQNLPPRGILGLGVRLQRAAAAIDEWMRPGFSNLETDNRPSDNSCRMNHKSNECSKEEQAFNSRCTVIHGDYKAENLFFVGKSLSSSRDCAVCDFQWVGFGIGAEDVFHLIATSLETELSPQSAKISSVEWELLEMYHDSLTYYGVSGYSFDQFVNDYDMAMLNYTRYAIGTGVMFEEDEWMVRRADRVLSEVDRGVPLTDWKAYSRSFRRKFIAQN